MQTKEKNYSILLFILMASTTALAILAELAPSGILLDMAQDLQIKESKAGILIGFYAFPSAAFAIPLMYGTLKINRKGLLQALLSIFVLTNLCISLVSSYPLIILCRLVGGTAAGLLWPMISAYGSKLVPERQAGKVIALIMSGGTLGLVVGIPVITYIGQNFHWRGVFLVISLLAGLILLLSSVFLPSVEGEREKKGQSVKTLLGNRSMRIILYLTLASITGYYCLYIYIAPLAGVLGYQGSITQAQFIFGIASFLSILLAMKLVGDHLHRLLLLNITTGILAMLIFMLARDKQGLLHLGFFLWGFGFGSLSSLCQATVALRIPWGRDMGNAIQSSSFNASIMLGAAIGGWALDLFSVKSLVKLALGLFLVSLAMIGKEIRTFNPEVRE